MFIEVLFPYCPKVFTLSSALSMAVVLGFGTTYEKNYFISSIKYSRQMCFNNSDFVR
jgi:hypothetical protein